VSEYQSIKASELKNFDTMTLCPWLWLSIIVKGKGEELWAVLCLLRF